jgi:O-antigen/teichoic acid export membrane protein
MIDKRETNASEDAPGPRLGVAATRGVFWVGGAQVFRQILGLITSVVLARLLAPTDFGLIALAYVFIELGQVFADFGVGAAVIQAKDVTRKVLSSAFWANVVVGCALMVIMLGAAPAVGYVYTDSRVAWVLASLSLTLLFSGMVVVPRATLYKDLRFNLAVKAQMIGSLVGAAVAISMAWFGMGVWSLVAQPICGSIITLTLTLRYARWRPYWEYSWNDIRGLAKFSADVLGMSVVGHINNNADKLLVGKFLGNASLGFYSLAFQLMLYPMTHVASVIMRVLFPTLSALQDDLPRFRNAYLKATAAIALITFPLMIGLLIVSRDFVEVVFGDKWLPMVPVLQVLCLVGMGKSVATTVGAVYLSTAHTRENFYIALVMLPLSVGAFVIGLRWGIVGVAAGYAAVALAFIYIYLGIAFRVIRLTFREFHAAIIRPFVGSLVMAMAVLFVQQLLYGREEVAAVVRLAISVAVGAGVYGLVSLIVNREQIDEIRRISFAALRSSKQAVAK